MSSYKVSGISFEVDGTEVKGTASGGIYDTKTHLLTVEGLKVTGLAKTASLVNLPSTLKAATIGELALRPRSGEKADPKPSSLSGKAIKASAHTAGSTKATFKVS